MQRNEDGDQTLGKWSQKNRGKRNCEWGIPDKLETYDKVGLWNNMG